MRGIKKSILAGLLGLALTGCAAQQPSFSDVTLTINASGHINNGVLLPIDVMSVNGIKAESVLAVTPEEWFGNDMRERLTAEEINKIAIRGGGSRQLKVRLPSDNGRIIVYADYENSTERIPQQIVIAPSRSGFAAQYHVKVGENRLELEQ